MDRFDVALIAAVIGCILTGVWIYQENYLPGGVIYQCSDLNPTYPKEVKEICKRLGK